MRALRILLAVLVLIAAAVTIVSVPWERRRCNAEKAVAEQFITDSGAIASDFERTQRALVLARRLEACTQCTPDDWQVFYLLGALQSMAGLKSEAIASYDAALHLEARPEIYYSISVLQLETGHGKEGLANAEKAVMFSLSFADEYDKQLRDSLFAKVFKRQDELQKKR